MTRVDGFRRPDVRTCTTQCMTALHQRYSVIVQEKGLVVCLFACERSVMMQRRGDSKKMNRLL